MPIEICHWWKIHVGYVSEEDIRVREQTHQTYVCTIIDSVCGCVIMKSATKPEHAVIDMLIDAGPRQAGEIDKSTVHSLYTKGLVYIEVPIDDDDYIISFVTHILDARSLQRKLMIIIIIIVQFHYLLGMEYLFVYTLSMIAVPPLEGFVMNRVLGDYFENLLYKLFVSVDERTNVQQLANILQIDIQTVKVSKPTVRVLFFTLHFFFCCAIHMYGQFLTKYF